MPDTSSRPGQKVAMISSTSLDLPEHREEAIKACERQSVFPLAMENLPASDADAIRVSLEMVDKADIYIGVFAWRYGHVPDGHDISITEMEFNRAVKRQIPILIFTIHDEHPLTIKMVETDTVAQEKLKKLKERACDGRGRLEFGSPVELRSHIIQSLADLLPKIDAAAGTPKAINFHPPNLIPAAPAPYIAHPYSLLQTSEVVGRRDELKLLTDWVTVNKEIRQEVRLFNVVAIGGMGKSALTWKWFNDIAPNELPHLKGRMWWSFYESDAYFENFVIRALAYTAGMTEAAVRELPSHEREDRLFHLLDQEPFLLVLDGLERILLAYSRMDTAHLADDDLDEQTANEIAQFYGLPDEVKETYLEKHRLRQCADPRAGRFLQRLARVRESRVLVSTRLYPAELQTMTAQPLHGCYPHFLTGLTNDDALALWRAFIGGERSGTSEKLLPLFNAFGNYPLLVRALAGRVANYRPAPGDFDRWHRDHPGFNPAAELDLRNAKTHVLHYALEGLGAAQRQVLHTVAAFRMPATWETLRAVLTGEDKPCQDERALDDVLTELEDRGLVGWDRIANRYDLHPIVRSVVKQGLKKIGRKALYHELHTYFEALPKPDWHHVHTLDDLVPTLELYHCLIELRRYEEAVSVFFDSLDAATHNRLSASRKRIELLTPLVELTRNGLPRLQNPAYLASTLNALGRAHNYDGNLHMAATYLSDALDLTNTSPLLSGPDAFSFCDLSNVLRPAGHLFKSRSAALKAIVCWRERRRFHQEMRSSVRLGLALAASGKTSASIIVLKRAMRLATKANPRKQAEGFVSSAMAQMELWIQQNERANVLAETAWVLAKDYDFERDFIRAARLQGEAALKVFSLTIADERLHHALTRARQVNFVEEELPALIALAELRRRQDQPDEAREYLDAVWDAAARGPYPLFHADALNVLAALERDLGHREAAIAAATESYKKAWCDGPPYAYHWGLEAARKHLRELGAPEPQLPPFDPSKFEPMPDVEINPKDEFYVEISEAEDDASPGSTRH